LGSSEFAVLAPTTDHAGAVKLADRVVAVLRGPMAGGDMLPAETAVRAGYDAVANLTYSPIDPAELLTRAATAVRHGSPDTRHPWVRRFDPKTAPASRATPLGLELDQRSVSS
jgi:GGDEF domain-containing protein